MLKWLGIELQGFGSEGAVLNFLINLVAIGLILYFFKIKPMLMAREGKDRRKREGNNPSPAPGNAEICKRHIKGLAEVKTEIKNIKEQSKICDEKNREDHQLMFDKIDKLKNKI